MTAPNHALTGAVIGLSIGNPAVALPLAFLSHFVCDLVPHYDPPGSAVERIRSRRFVREQLVVGSIVCFLIVLALAVGHPHHWFQAAVCAFLAASPDLFWIPRFLYVRRTGKDLPLRNSFLKFHSALQWKTGPKLIWIEAIWFVVLGAGVIARL